MHPDPLPIAGIFIGGKKIADVKKFNVAFGIPKELMAGDFCNYSSSKVAQDVFESKLKLAQDQMTLALTNDLAIMHEAMLIDAELPADLRAASGRPPYALAAAFREFEAALVLSEAGHAADAKRRAAEIRYWVCWRLLDPRTGELTSGVHRPWGGLPFALAYTVQYGLLQRMMVSQCKGRVWLEAVENSPLAN